MWLHGFYSVYFTRYSLSPFLCRQGILLWGPPGTGKTLSARAVANRTDACFIRVIGTPVDAVVQCAHPSLCVLVKRRMHAVAVIIVMSDDCCVVQVVSWCRSTSARARAWCESCFRWRGPRRRASFSLMRCGESNGQPSSSVVAQCVCVGAMVLCGAWSCILRVGVVVGGCCLSQIVRALGWVLMTG